MKRQTVTGSALLALTHMAGYGLALILQESKASDVRIGWDLSGPDQAGVVTWEEGPVDAGEALRDHVARHAHSDSWLQNPNPWSSKSANLGLFSARIRSKGKGGWQYLADTRRNHLDNPESGLSWLDEDMIGALGQPAFWLNSKKKEEDKDYTQGATRWDMVAGNGGREMIGTVLAKVAKVLQKRDSRDLLGGISGTGPVDEHGKGKSDLGAAGLQPPGPVDNALVWCGLWGIAMMSCVPQVRTMSQTPGTWPRNRAHPQYHALPVFSEPVAPARVRAVIGSKALDAVAFPFDRKDPLEVEAARSWLTAAGVGYVVRFPVAKKGPTQAPWRELNEAEPIDLTSR